MDKGSMMKTAGFKKRMLDGDRLVGTFIKTAVA